MSYQSVPLYPELVPALSADREENAFEVEFDRPAGIKYLWVIPSILVPCCAPLFMLCGRKNMEAQKCKITDRRVVFESGWLDHSNKNIPLDRIQDVNVRQDCIQKCFGVKTIEIQTAGMGGGIEPEARLIAPVDAMMVRDVIMDRRDALVLGNPGLSDVISGDRAKSESGRKEQLRRLDQDKSNELLVTELRSMKDSMSRLEAQVKAGVELYVQSQQEKQQ